MTGNGLPSVTPMPGLGRSEPMLLAAARAGADLLVLMAAFGLSYHLYVGAIRIGWLDRVPPEAEPYVAIAVLFSVIGLLVFWKLGLYRQRLSVLNLWELRATVKGVLLSAAFFFALLFFLRLSGYSRFVVVGAIALAAILLLLERRVFSLLVRRSVLRGRYARRTLIYGSGETGRLLMKKIVQTPQAGCTVVGFVDDAVAVGSAVYCRVAQTPPILFRAPVLGRLQDLTELARRYEADELLVAAPSTSPPRLQEILDACRAAGLAIGVVPHLGDFRVDQLQIEDLSAIPVVRAVKSKRRPAYLVVKRAFDLAAASLLLILTAPIWVAAAIAIRLESPGPVFFVQERVGLHGRRFRMFKFRTMWQDTDPYSRSPDRDDEDPRITRVGRILRIGGLDELPQLLNVVRGDMSLVGPRPEMPFIAERYTPLQRQRFSARPGITGLWQLSADRHGQIHENIEYDQYYVEHRSFLLDLLILLETVLFTLGTIVSGLRRAPARARPVILSVTGPSPPPSPAPSPAELYSTAPGVPYAGPREPLPPSEAATSAPLPAPAEGRVAG